MSNIGCKWVDGNQVYYNKATGATLFTLKSDGTLEFENGQHIKGSRFTVAFPQVQAADVAKTFWMAPAACKVISAMERHVTIAGQAGTLNIEKLESGDAPGAGDVVLDGTFDLTSTANTPVSVDALGTAAATLAAGDALALVIASGSAASYALGTIVVTMEWL